MTSAALPPQAGDRSTSYLPSAHIADRWASHYTGMTFGPTITYVPDPKAVVGALGEVKPTVWGAVPRVWEKIKAALEANGITDPSVLPEETKAGVRGLIGLDQMRWSVSGRGADRAGGPRVLRRARDPDLPSCGACPSCPAARPSTRSTTSGSAPSARRCRASS